MTTASREAQGGGDLSPSCPRREWGRGSSSVTQCPVPVRQSLRWTSCRPCLLQGREISKPSDPTRWGECAY